MLMRRYLSILLLPWTFWSRSWFTLFHLDTGVEVTIDALIIVRIIDHILSDGFGLF